MTIAGRAAVPGIAALLLGIGVPAAAGINTWTGHGLEGGNVIALVIDPTTPSTLYAGTRGGGAFKSTNGGGSWSAVNAGLTDLRVAALAFDPVTPGTVYVGAAGD
ncbi:MAG TPA: hypothetical protein VGX21_00690, partial [Methylomirabilota bacterium]|nr:hypothetical protein [Methylomirabilota bacterium]